MLILGRRGEKIKLLHFVPRFQSKNCRYAKKNDAACIWGILEKTAECMPCTAHHLLPLPMRVNGSNERKLQASDAEENHVRKLNLNILFNINNIPWQ
jgi:hypothetical protein